MDILADVRHYARKVMSEQNKLSIKGLVSCMDLNQSSQTRKAIVRDMCTSMVAQLLAHSDFDAMLQKSKNFPELMLRLRLDVSLDPPERHYGRPLFDKDTPMGPTMVTEGGRPVPRTPEWYDNTWKCSLCGQGTVVTDYLYRDELGHEMHDRCRREQVLLMRSVIKKIVNEALQGIRDSKSSPLPMNKCECGVDATGGGLHSDWCPKAIL